MLLRNNLSRKLLGVFAVLLLAQATMASDKTVHVTVGKTPIGVGFGHILKPTKVTLRIQPTNGRRIKGVALKVQNGTTIWKRTNTADGAHKRGTLYIFDVLVEGDSTDAAVFSGSFTKGNGAIGGKGGGGKPDVFTLAVVTVDILAPGIKSLDETVEDQGPDFTSGLVIEKNKNKKITVNVRSAVPGKLRISSQNLIVPQLVFSKENTVNAQGRLKVSSKSLEFTVKGDKDPNKTSSYPVYVEADLLVSESIKAEFIPDQVYGLYTAIDRLAVSSSLASASVHIESINICEGDTDTHDVMCHIKNTTAANAQFNWKVSAMTALLGLPKVVLVNPANGTGSILVPAGDSKSFAVKVKLAANSPSGLAGLKLVAGPNNNESHGAVIVGLNQDIVSYEPFDLVFDKKKYLDGKLIAVSSAQKNTLSVHVHLDRSATAKARVEWNNLGNQVPNNWNPKLTAKDQAGKKWLWPKLHGLFTIDAGDADRYGDYDPTKKIDNDYMAFVVRKYKANGTASGPHLITAIWKDNGVQNGNVTHTAVSEKLVLKPCCAGEVYRVWVIMADLFGRNYIEDGPEDGRNNDIAGGPMAYFEIHSEHTIDGTEFHVIQKPVPLGWGGYSEVPKTGFDWNNWDEKSKLSY